MDAYQYLTVRNELGKTWSAKVDNFDESNTDTYQQRFYVNDVYWQGKGPVFLYIGGEGTLNGPPGTKHLELYNCGTLLSWLNLSN